MRAKDRTGLIGEQVAAQWLTTRGHQVLATRWRSRTGELDLVTEHRGDLVAVEVKTRRGIGYGHPFEAVTAEKLYRLHRLLSEYASTHQCQRRRRRVDVVSVLLDRDDATQDIEHLEDVRP
ncbi:YraN family protein [Nesterenkonia alba]|uniref:YraN family protein n=1 Tax=Nesterenkonia alba TaxID=515814 RepID=UPI000407E71E|nr:YraN family protein [Nesterenkonia alba]